MPYINTKTDFEFVIQLNAINGELTSQSIFDFEGKIYCIYDNCIGRQYTFCRHGDTYHNCRFEQDGLHILVANHSLGIGVLACEFTAIIPDATFPQGVRRVTEHVKTDIRLILPYQSKS